MQHQEDLRHAPPVLAELREIESRLGRLGPAAHGIDRDALMFQAGRASGAASDNASAGPGRRDVRLWQGAFGMMVGVCAGMAVVGVGRTRTVEKVVVVHDAPVGAGGAGGANQALAPQTGLLAAGPHGSSADLGPAAPEGRETLFTAGAGGMGSAQMAFLGMRTEAPIQGSAAGAPGYRPTLRTSEGLDALPDWQKRALLFPGGR